MASKTPGRDRWNPGSSEIHGQGAFAMEPIPEGDFIDLVMTQLDLLGGEQTEFGKYLNHQSFPNGRIERVPSTQDKYYLRSIQNIDPGNEITMDYNNSPDFVSKPHEIDPEGYKDWK